MAGFFNNLFRKKESELLNFSVLGSDMHAHLLPAIDDGAGDMDAALNMIKGLQELGFRKFIATPHIMPEVFDNTPELIREKQQLLNTSALPMLGTEVAAAAEYYIDGGFAERVRNGEKLLTFGDNYVLVEVSMMTKEKFLEEALFEMRLQGYKPVLAHVERYPYMFEHNKLEQYERLRDADVLLQVNLRSFTGNYGEIQKRIARALTDAGLVNFLGTDLHNTAQLPIVKQSMSDPHVQQLLRSGRLMNSQL